MEFQHTNLTVELKNDNLFDPKSADNVVTYKKIHGFEVHTCASAAHGISVRLQGVEIASAILFGYGGATTIHERSFIISNDIFLLSCGDSVYSLHLPYLDIRWHKKMDSATCLGIYQFKDDFIMHGELDITRFDKNGFVKWIFSGNDIFVSLNSNNNFTIEGENIIVKDFDDNVYVLNADGTLAQ